MSFARVDNVSSGAVDRTLIAVSRRSGTTPQRARALASERAVDAKNDADHRGAVTDQARSQSYRRWWGPVGSALWRGGPEPAVCRVGLEDEDEDESDDWLTIEALGSRPGYRDMERLIASCQDIPQWIGSAARSTARARSDLPHRSRVLAGSREQLVSLRRGTGARESARVSRRRRLPRRRIPSPPGDSPTARQRASGDSVSHLFGLAGWPVTIRGDAEVSTGCARGRAGEREVHADAVGASRVGAITGQGPASSVQMLDSQLV
jgi:hypothetical protein